MNVVSFALGKSVHIGDYEIMAEEDADLGDFFAEIEEIQAAPAADGAEADLTATTALEDGVASSSSTAEEIPKATYTQPVSIVYSKAPEIREETSHSSHPVYTYNRPDYSVEDDDPYSRYYFSEGKSSKPASSSSRAQTVAPPPPPPPVIPRSDKTFVRKAADETWVDETLQEWPENDFRIFIGDLGKEVTTEMLTRHFQQYKSFAMAKAVRGKDGKPKGFGFVSFLEPGDCIKAMKEENGKYLGSR